MPRLWSSLPVLLLLCLSIWPSQALPLTLSGPGLTPCGAGQCVDLTWHWEEFTTISAGEVIVVLPIPDPEQWVLNSGSFDNGSTSIIGGAEASFGGTFNGEDLGYDFNAEHLTAEAGHTSPQYQTIGSNGALLTENTTGLTAFCGPGQPGPTVGCSDGNSTNTSWYDATVGDPAFQGPLTFRYDFHPNWHAEPISHYFRIYWTGRIHLVYTAIPEPTSSLLVISGLLSLAGWRRVRA